MRRLLLAAALPVLAGAACDARHGTGAGPFPDGGRFVAERVARRTTTLLDSPAWATYCLVDSSLVIVALSRGWNGGFALRAVLPIPTLQVFQIGGQLGGLGTATAGFRAPDAGAAHVGVGGTIRVAAPATTVSGSFDVSLPDSAGVHVAIRGTLARVPLALLTTATCRAP